MGAPKVFVIVLNYNGKEDTARCLESLKAVAYPAYEVLVVDNASGDGSAAYLRAGFPGLRLIENGENLGYSAGNNVAIRRAMGEGADYVLLLNNDTVVDTAFLGELVKAAEADRRIGIAGPKIYYDGPGDVVYFAGATIDWYTGRTRHTGIGTADPGHSTEPRRADFIPGAAMLVRRSVVETVGLLPGEYFLQYEDIDYSVNAARHGFRLAYVPGAVVWHKSGASTSKIRAEKAYLETRNRFVFLKKYSTGAQYVCSTLYFVLYYGPLGALYTFLCTGDPRVLLGYWKGLIAGLAGGAAPSGGVRL